MSKPPITVKVMNFVSEVIPCSFQKGDTFWPTQSIDADGNGTATIHFEAPRHYRELADGREEMRLDSPCRVSGLQTEIKLMYPCGPLSPGDGAESDWPLIWRSNEQVKVVGEAYSTSFGSVRSDGRALTPEERRSVDGPAELR